MAIVDPELDPIFNVKPRAKPTPGPLGGDIAGVRTLDLSLSIISGRHALAQAILRRLTTPRGGLVGDPTYGYDLLNAVGATETASSVESRTLEQVVAEEEVEEAKVAATFKDGLLRVFIHVVDGGGPFDLTVTATDLTLEAFIADLNIFQETR